MADAIGDGLGRENVSYKIFHMAVSDRNDVLAEVFKTKAIVVGSPALNNGVLPTLTPILEDLRGLRFKNKIGAAFGPTAGAVKTSNSSRNTLTSARFP